MFNHGTNQQTIVCQGAKMFHNVLQVVLSSSQLKPEEKQQ